MGTYELTARDAPVEAFWSISVYNAAGYFVPNDRRHLSINSVTAEGNNDDSTTVGFGDGDLPNTVPIMDGWNYAVRLCQPRPEIIDGAWTFPDIAPNNS